MGIKRRNLKVSNGVGSRQASKKAKLHSRGERLESGRTSPDGGNGLRALARGISRAEHQTLPELCLIVAHGQGFPPAFLIYGEMIGEEIKAIPLVGAIPNKLFSGIFVKRKAKAKVLVVLNPESCVQVVGIAEIPRAEGAVSQRVRRAKPSSSFPDPALPEHEIGILLAV